ncbi:MAG: DUF4389 domain-containing protein [archaeon]|nr:DUF4389 domain-containing protein [Nanoarchaeota archaeon]
MASERLEALMRIVVCVVTGIILYFWFILVKVLTIVHWVVVILTGKRNKTLSGFAHNWNQQVYLFLKYITFATNKRPFPFTKLGTVDKLDMK